MAKVGDYDGHPFRGNQYKKAGGRGTPERAEKARELRERRVEVQAQRQVMASGQAVYSMSHAINERKAEIREGGPDAPGHYAAPREKVQAAVAQARRDAAAGYPGDPYAVKDQYKYVDKATGDLSPGAGLVRGGPRHPLAEKGVSSDLRAAIARDKLERADRARDQAARVAAVKQDVADLRLVTGTGYVAAVPDRAHLARENKIPAAVMDSVEVSKAVGKIRMDAFEQDLQRNRELRAHPRVTTPPGKYSPEHPRVTTPPGKYSPEHPRVTTPPGKYSPVSRAERRANLNRMKSELNAEARKYVDPLRAFRVKDRKK